MKPVVARCGSTLFPVVCVVVEVFMSMSILVMSVLSEMCSVTAA
jgi:hypothetical protein